MPHTPAGKWQAQLGKCEMETGVQKKPGIK